MDRDRLFLIRPGFFDPELPGRTFYCWHCALLEGVLGGFPELAARLDVVRVDWARPREAVIEVAGEENQSLPLLVLAPGGRASNVTGLHGGYRLVADKDAILATLTERHGFPAPHP